MIGTMDTYGKHFWFDKRIWTLPSFIAALSEEVKSRFFPYAALVIRDFIPQQMDMEEYRRYSSKILALGIKEIEIMSVGHLAIHPFKSIEAYLNSLRARPRHNIKQAINKRSYQSRLTSAKAIASLLEL